MSNSFIDAVFNKHQANYYQRVNDLCCRFFHDELLSVINIHCENKLDEEEMSDLAQAIVDEVLNKTLPTITVQRDAHDGQLLINITREEDNEY